MTENASTYIDRNSDNKLEEYYRFHAQIYDATRWSFLFGRKAILNMIPDLPSQPKIMEIGCGTGRNIRRMASHFPDAQILGVDLSPDMLSVAYNKLDNSAHVDLLNANYGSDRLNEGPFDLILLSYSLTMIENKLEDVLIHISNDLKLDGHVAIVDFHTSPFGWFRRWMNINHVNLEGTLFPTLHRHFRAIGTKVNNAYTGLWSYFLFVGNRS